MTFTRRTKILLVAATVILCGIVAGGVWWYLSSRQTVEPTPTLDSVVNGSPRLSERGSISLLPASSADYTFQYPANWTIKYGTLSLGGREIPGQPAPQRDDIPIQATLRSPDKVTTVTIQYYRSHSTRSFRGGMAGGAPACFTYKRLYEKTTILPAQPDLKYRESISYNTETENTWYEFSGAVVPASDAVPQEWNTCGQGRAQIISPVKPDISASMTIEMPNDDKPDLNKVKQWIVSSDAQTARRILLSLHKNN